MPMWRSQWSPSGNASRLLAKASRGHGSGARLKYSASPLSRRTSLTVFGSNSIAASSTGVASVAISAPEASSVSATARMPAAGAKGSSPCRFTTTVSSSQPAIAAHSASRSLAEACAGDVTAMRTPLPSRAPAMRSSPAATQTSLAPAASARRATCSISGSPPSRRNGLPGSREAAWRAGMATMKSGMGFANGIQQRDPEGLGQLRADRDAEVALAGEAGALHRVLLRHQYRQVAAEIEIFRDEPVVVGERVRHHRDAAAAQHGEEALGVADAGHGVHALAGEALQRQPATTQQWHRLVGRLAHQPFAEARFGVPDGVVEYVEVAVGGTRHRLAQRTGRDHLAVAVAAGRVQDLDLDVT